MSAPSPSLSRRSFLLGLSAALTLPGAKLALAHAAGEARLVVVLLRGGLDSLYVVQPYGEATLATLRGPLALPEPGMPGGLQDLGGFFGLHPVLAHFHERYRAHELLILHAVAGPWRTRSHFTAQDLLESGAERVMTSGWLNRALSGLPAAQEGRRSQPLALAIGTEVPLLLRGAAAVSSYAPSTISSPSPDLLARIVELTHGDPLLGPAIREGLRARGYAEAVLGQGALREAARERAERGNFPILARIGGRLLAAADGPRIAAFELAGWDTHAEQANRLLPPLRELDAGIAVLHEALGEAWRHTAILIMTEFGRTARINGTNGTDHGTAGCAFLLGGAVAGGRVVADWPGLRENQLFEGRDLAPTLDLRSVIKGLLADHLQLPETALLRAFPDSADAPPLRGLIRRA